MNNSGLDSLPFSWCRHRNGGGGSGASQMLLIVSLSAMFWIAASVHAADRLELEGTTITGNQELPKALHIVPWKSSDAGELAARPMNSLIDEILAPIDRDVFLRELEYYEALHRSR